MQYMTKDGMREMTPETDISQSKSVVSFTIHKDFDPFWFAVRLLDLLFGRNECFSYKDPVVQEVSNGKFLFRIGPGDDFWLFCDGEGNYRLPALYSDMNILRATMLILERTLPRYFEFNHQHKGVV